MFETKKINKLMIVCPIFGFIMLFCVFSIISGKANLGISSFAVDSLDRVYIGTSQQIEVYEGGILKYTINPQTSKSYVFTILDDDTILLSTATTVYSMDLSGNILDSWEDRATETYHRISKNKNKFMLENGDEYKLKGWAGWTRIVKNGETVVYRITVFSFAVKLILYITVISMGLITISELRRRKIL